MTLNKNANLTIYVGGQDGYNGGGETSDIYGNGGGATDIRLESRETSKRIIVAGGGSGSNATPNYHRHTGSSSSGGGCYGKAVYTSIKKPVPCGRSTWILYNGR